MRQWSYGLTDKQYTTLIRKQRNKCGICRKSFDLVRAVVDHDHRTDKVRGLLCDQCNTGIGKLGDTIQGLASAMTYIGKHLEGVK